MGTAIRFSSWIFLFVIMRIAYLHTKSLCQDIKNLILDIQTNLKSSDIMTYEVKNCDFRWFRLHELFRLRRFLRKNKIDIVHTYHYIDAYCALLASRLLKTKVIYSAYSYHDELSGLSKRIFQRVLSNVDSIVFQTNTQKNKFISTYNLDQDKHYKLFHGFSMKRFDEYSRESVRDEFFIDDFRYLIGTLGDFTPEHDVMNVFKMVKKLRKTGRNFTCVVAGEQLEDHEFFFNECKYYYLMQGLDNYITFVGARNDVPSFLSQLDAFVYHSDNEVIALPVIQAMLSGVNVVVNDSEMIKEITSNGKYATIYKTNDSADFANNTRQLLIDLEDYQIIAQTIKEETREIFSIKRHVAGLKEIYSKVNNH